MFRVRFNLVTYPKPLTYSIYTLPLQNFACLFPPIAQTTTLHTPTIILYHTMALRAYPDDREHNPVQLTLLQFVDEGIRYYEAIKGGSKEDELTFLKFILAGRRGLDINDQDNITLNVSQGLPDIRGVNATRDFDSLIGTTKTLPYSVPVTIWPAPSFRDTLTTNSHVTAIALDNEVCLG